MFCDPFAKFDRLFNDARSFQPPVLTTVKFSYAPNLPVKERQSHFRPRMDLFEAKEGNVVTATFELPGLTSEDVMIDVQENRLTISGETSVHAVPQEAGYTVRERHPGKFSRTLRLPIGTKAEDVKARMENGILTVTFPRVNPEQQPHRVAIERA